MELDWQREGTLWQAQRTRQLASALRRRSFNIDSLSLATKRAVGDWPIK
jgi:hypothetical protein